MNTSHTPGPWIATIPPSSCFAHRLIEAVRENEPNIRLVEVGGEYFTGSIPGLARISVFQHTANARLIAAAPDLLSELRHLLDVAKVIDAGNKNQYGSDCHGFSPKSFAHAEAIIAKATH